VTVSDATGQTGSSALPLMIPVSTCGSAPVTATYVATQHFDGIVQLQPGATDPTPAPLDITQTPPSLTPISTLDVSGTSRTFDVPFYLDRRISLDVKVTLPPGCASAHLDGSQVRDPTSAIVPDNLFTHPDPGNVTDGQHLQFTLTARIGDTPNGSGGTSQGFYALQMFITSGSSNDGFSIVQSDTPVHVGGRCGLNAPTVNATFAPSSGSVGTLVDATAVPSDDDNVIVEFTPADDPSHDPGTSTGCGLDQAFTYLWSFTHRPDPNAVLSPPDSQVSHFTPKVDGTYVVKLVIGDGTTSGVNGDGTTESEFSYVVSP